MSEVKEPTIQKRKKGLETSRKIMEVSAALFAEKGYDAVSIRDIAASTGIKESSLYNHYTGKGEILEKLFSHFAANISFSRPKDEELEGMLSIMTPEEIMRQIIFRFGQTIDETIDNIARIIHSEKFRNETAAKLYMEAMIKEPCEYYARLISRMSDKGLVGPVDAQLVAEQYNYALNSLTMEYAMAKSSGSDPSVVVRKMLRCVGFFCSVMKSCK